jgi:D-glycero-D-manno-heptose 1,7-bisphosphate phosphatase
VRPAVFFDRDGTLIELVHHLADPAEVKILPCAGPALSRLRASGYACVLITNQSAIGRGLLTVDGLHEVHAEFLRQLAQHSTELDGFYYSPLKPTIKDPTVIEHPDRKPGPGLLLRAAAELGLDLSRSWMVGDTVSDMLAGKNAGCRGSILVRTGYGREPPVQPGVFDYIVDDAGQATELILALDGKNGETT